LTAIYHEVVPRTVRWRPFERALAIAMLVLVPLNAVYAVYFLTQGDLALGLVELASAIVGFGLFVFLARQGIADRRSANVTTTPGAR
jgi:hypothetical protein